MIKAYQLTGERFVRLELAFKELMRHSIRIEGLLGPIVLASIAFLRSGLTWMVIIGVYLLLGSQMDVIVFVSFLIVGTRIYDPLTTALVNFAEFRYHEQAGERIVQLLNEPVMPGDQLSPEGHDIELRHIRFGYGDQPVLRDVSMSMPFQDVYLFQDTIANNIRFGKSSATQEEIEAAARQACCHDFITKLPKGYDTWVGEGGSTLSGGEKQRISIARAILKDTPIVLLDEATSSLDPENEKDIQQAINRLVQGRTVIAIAHRLKTIRNADRIVVLDKGMIVEQGRHDELLADNGLYARLWKRQHEVRES